MAMAEHCGWETFKAETAMATQQLKKLLREGNARRVIVTQHDRVIAEFPMTAGVIGVAIAPVVAAVGAMVALLQDCAIHVERREPNLPTVAPAAAPSEVVQS
jgi:hypothetical protein